MKRIAAILMPIYIIMCVGEMSGQTAVFGNLDADTLRINGILRRYPRNATIGQGMEYVAGEFAGTPYAAGTLEGETEQLRVRLDSLDCTTFVETVAALVMTGNEGRVSWRDFIYNITSLRYRSGHVNGYASRLHYFSDWVMDNKHRGNIEEVTDRYQRTKRVVKSLDYMSRHREAYPALADSAEHARIRSIEGGYRNHAYPQVTATAASSRDFEAFLRAGDIIAFTTGKPGLDVTHLGIITTVDGEPRLTHASSQRGAVVTEQQPLKEYLRRNGGAGVRIVRLKQ